MKFPARWHLGVGVARHHRSQCLTRMLCFSAGHWSEVEHTPAGSSLLTITDHFLVSKPLPYSSLSAFSTKQTYISYSNHAIWPKAVVAIQDSHQTTCSEIFHSWNAKLKGQLWSLYSGGDHWSIAQRRDLKREGAQGPNKLEELDRQKYYCKFFFFFFLPHENTGKKKKTTAQRGPLHAWQRPRSGCVESAFWVFTFSAMSSSSSWAVQSLKIHNMFRCLQHCLLVFQAVSTPSSWLPWTIKDQESQQKQEHGGWIFKRRAVGDPSSQQWFLGCVLFLFFILFPHLFSKNDFAYKMVSANFAACQFQHPVLCSREK